jgi:hypothetical protein
MILKISNPRSFIPLKYIIEIKILTIESRIGFHFETDTYYPF